MPIKQLLLDIGVQDAVNFWVLAAR